MKTIGIVGDRKAFRNENYYAVAEACGAGTETLDINDSPDITTSISRSKGNSVPSYLLAHKAHIRYRKRSKGKRQQSYQMRPDQQ